MSIRHYPIYFGGSLSCKICVFFRQLMFCHKIFVSFVCFAAFFVVTFVVMKSKKWFFIILGLRGAGKSFSGPDFNLHVKCEIS